jgi:hypothetical protein
VEEDILRLAVISIFCNTKGRVIIYGGGWHRREMFFVPKILLTQPLKNQKFYYPTSNII